MTTATEKATDKERDPRSDKEPRTLTASASPEQRSLDAMWERLYIRV